MKALKNGFLLAALTLGAGLQAQAQVEKVALRTTGISCGSCAEISEVFLKKLAGVSNVNIVVEKELIMLTLKPNIAFQPWDIREVLEKSEVGVVQIQISAKGAVTEENGKKFLVAGKDKFVILPTSVAKVETGVKGTFQGTVNDHPDPMELKLLSFTPETK